MSDNQTAGISAKELESIESKKLGELQVIAKSIGIKRVTGVRKKDLIDQIIIYFLNVQYYAEICSIANENALKTPL